MMTTQHLFFRHVPFPLSSGISQLVRVPGRTTLAMSRRGSPSMPSLAPELVCSRCYKRESCVQCCGIRFCLRVRTCCRCSDHFSFRGEREDINKCVYEYILYHVVASPFHAVTVYSFCWHWCWCGCSAVKGFFAQHMFYQSRQSDQFPASSPALC